jgi:hypothetical protein
MIMTTAQDLVDFLEITVLKPTERNPKITGVLKRNNAFVRMLLRRMAKKNKPESIIIIGTVPDESY